MKDLLIPIASGVDVIKNKNVVLTILNALPDSYENFVQGILVQETLPSFDQLISKLLQLKKHNRRNIVSEVQKSFEEKED
jgi:hypothetical protein